MPPKLPIEAVEVFHLLLLRVMQTRLERGSYVVKGGVNLRAWFGSARYSEDMDLDATSGGSHELRDKIDMVLTSPALETLLRSQQLKIVRTSKPKQTETTQRWKFEIESTASKLPLHTKIEFSRRGSDEPYELGPARSDVVRAYGLPTPTANHYTAPAAIRQKIEALASRREPQARDIWDLDHLLRTTGADPRPLSPGLQEAVTVALDRTFETPFEVFRAQVVPFLTADHQEIFGTSEAWDRIRETVIDRLSELQP